jgi:hypothetical protein
MRLGCRRVVGNVVTRIGPRAIAAAAAAQVLTSCVVVAGSRGGGSSGSFFLLLLPLVFVLVMVGFVRRRQRAGQRTGPAHLMSYDADTTNVQVLRAELSVLADDVVRLEPQVVLKEEARDDFEAATHRYRVAQAALDYAKEPVDLVRVQRVVDEANWAMSRARAILDGRPPPTPPGMLQRPGIRGEPAVGLDDEQRPMYVDSPAAFRSGWFSAGGGLFGGLLLGSVLGGLGGGWSVHEHDVGPEGGEPELGGW